MSSPLRALSPGSSLSSFDICSPSRRNSESTRSHGNLSSSESDDSYGTASDEDGSSDDEVVLSFSDLSSADFLSQRGDPHTPAVFSDTESEFVLMSRPLSPDDLAASFSALSMTSTHSSRRRSNSTKAQAKPKQEQSAAVRGSPKRRSRRGRAAAPVPENALASSGTKPEDPQADEKHQSPSKARRKARRAAARSAASTPTPGQTLTPATDAKRKASGGLGDRPIVDDVSEAGSEYLCVPPEVYERAQQYVSSVLADPAVKADVPRLEFLHALIIELGLYTSLPSLPNSMRAAKALLKSQVFLNVRDYLAVRSQGIDALRSVMHPSRSALMREIRGGKRVHVKSVKASGLDVLLVTCYR